MNKNKNFLFKHNFFDSDGRNNPFHPALRIHKGTWPNILADIYCLPDIFEDSVILYRKGNLFVFLNISETFAEELEACSKGSYQHLKLESIGTWSKMYDTFLIHKQKDKKLSILRKVHETTQLFEYFKNKLSSITAYIKMADLLSEDSYVRDTVLKSSNVKYCSCKTFLKSDGSKFLGGKYLKKIRTCPSDQISLRKLRKVVSSTPNWWIYRDTRPLFKEVPRNDMFPQQVSDEQSGSERTEFAFSSGMSLPFATESASGLAVGNESLSGYYPQGNSLPPPRYPKYLEYNARLRSFSRWIRRHPDSITLSKAGFFYTDNGDLVRCYQCGIGLKDFSEGDDPLREHVRHSRRCLYLIQLIGESRLMEWKRQLQDPEYNRQMQLSGQRNVTSSYRHPEYQTVQARLETFTNWPAYMIQTPLQLAEAGLYYTGFEDQVRCFACDGGLRRWDPDDDPWTEHCRWFPACRFAIETKGDEFIALVQATNAFENEDNETSRSNSQSRDPDLSREMEQMTLRDPEFRAALNESKDACLEMGYQLNDFNEAVQELRNRGTIKPTTEEIIDVIEVVKERQLRESNLKARKDETPLEVNQRLKSFLTCLSCGKENVNALFLPCAHHRLCMECAESLTHCPVCERYISQKVKTYLV